LDLRDLDWFALAALVFKIDIDGVRAVDADDLMISHMGRMVSSNGATQHLGVVSERRLEVTADGSKCYPSSSRRT
jgi:hypothetical protein